jgi:hypothetical protein
MFILAALLSFPLYAAETDQAPLLLDKARLQCLYDQADSLLGQPDPVLVLLTVQCGQAKVPASGERTQSPEINPSVGENPTLQPEDVLVLSHAQLRCFKQGFGELMQAGADPLAVAFPEHCQETAP